MATPQSQEKPHPEPASRPILLRPSNDGDATVLSVERKENLFAQTMLALQDQAFSPDQIKVFNRRWRIGKAAEMVGTSRQNIRAKEKNGLLTAPEKDANGRYAAYTLEQINEMRDLFGTRPHRAPTDEPAVLSFSTFKGGCGKSTMSVHFAQYMALKGYRVLVIDCDPQGSATTLFGLNPDLPETALSQDVDSSDDYAEPRRYSLEEYLGREFTDFSLCIRPSYFPGIDLIPADMGLNNAEYQLAADIRGNPALLNELRDGIQSVWQDYDVIVMDPPPALGLLSLSVMNAANALVIPLRPTVVDFASTSKFMTMMKANLEAMVRAGLPVFYHFETLLVNNMDDSKSAHLEITDAMKTMFSEVDLLGAMMKDSAEIDNAGKEMKTVYDLMEPITSYETHNRCVTYLDRVNSEIETRVRKIWPSHKESLREEAQI
jgi:chromosome partitioning protein